MGAARRGQTGAAETQTGAAESQSGHTRLSAQQQTHIRQSVLSERSVPRVQANDIHFTVHRGVAVPSRVSVVSVSRYPALIDAFPSYRDDSFFVTEDEIIFVSPDRQIVNVVPVGPRAPFAREGGSYGYTAVNLPPDQIREVQEVLIQRGYLHGEADGVFGPRTRDALIAFQRKEGIQANGTISTRTVAALGLSNRIETQGQSSTVGEGREGAQQPNKMGRDHGRMNNEPAHNRATTGEASGQHGTREPSSQQHQPRAGQNTTGEATPHNKSTAGESGNQPANKSTQKPGGNQGMQSGAQGTTGEGNGQAPGQSNAQSPGQGAGTSSQGSGQQGSGQQGSGSTPHNR
ncbi:MAG: peptidoglycan-binding domain-containing protein [Bradyrhizobium sp.]